MSLRVDTSQMNFWKINKIDKRTKAKVNDGIKLQNGSNVELSDESSDGPKLSVVSLHRDSSTGHVTQILRNDILLDSYLAGKSYNEIMKALRKENETMYNNMSDEDVLNNILNQL